MFSGKPSQRVLPALIIKGFMLGLALFLMFLAGFFANEWLSPGSASIANADPGDFTLLREVQSLLEANYVRELPQQRDLEYAAIRGLLSTLNDPYTIFVDPPVAQSEADVLAGQYGGIGVQVQHAASGDYILYPFPNGPAAEAGIEDGDILLAIDERSITAADRIDEIDQLMRGEVAEGSGVDILVRKQASNEEQVYFVEFAVIEVPSVIWRVLVEDSRIGYVQIIRFTSRTPEELRQALQELGEAGISAWILDVRNNAGGLLQEAIQVADEFLDEGVVLYEITRDSERTFEAETGGMATEQPIIVLINHGTASAAELVAGAIRDNGRGALIGQPTYGKGSVQLIFPLSDGSSLHVTSSEWFTAARAQLEGSGLAPDINMIPAEDGRDVELDEAIRQLAAQLES